MADDLPGPSIPFHPETSRRSLLRVGLPVGAAALLGLRARPVRAADTPISSYFPRTEEDAVAGIVGAAHSDLERVKTLLAARPTLANAVWDWGFGDWESALGAASHMGRRDIAEALLEKGARADLFTHAMLGHLAAVRAIVEARPGIQRVLGPHGITLLSHARAGKEAAAEVVRYLEGLGDADRGAESVPLGHPLAAYLGTYAYGATDAERFEIIDQRGTLAFRKGGGFGRGLYHLGGEAFHPVSAPAVRIEFRFEGERAAAVTVRDAALEVVARRVDG